MCRKSILKRIADATALRQLHQGFGRLFISVQQVQKWRFSELELSGSIACQVPSHSTASISEPLVGANEYGIMWAHIVLVPWKDVIASHFHALSLSHVGSDSWFGYDRIRRVPTMPIMEMHLSLSRIRCVC